MRYLLTSLLCLTLFVTSVTCQDDDVTPEPDAEAADEETADDEQADTENTPETEDSDTEPENEGTAEDDSTTTAPGDSASCTVVSMATFLSISLLHIVMV